MELPSQMYKASADKAKVLVVGSTTSPWNLPVETLLGFQTRLYIPLPDVDTRFELLRRVIGAALCAMQPED